MPNTWDKYELDDIAEAEGVWVQLDDEIQVKVAAFNNPLHERVLRKLRKPYRNILRTGGEIPPQAQEDITIKSMVEAILKDWDGITDREGQSLPFTPANAEMVLRELKPLREKIAWLSMESETFNRAALEAAAGNLPSGSDGSSKAGSARKTKVTSSA